ncbi:MAG: hypothetical protein ACTSVI_09620 [Promethearchaeota archaeon]
MMFPDFNVSLGMFLLRVFGSFRHARVPGQDHEILNHAIRKTCMFHWYGRFFWKINGVFREHSFFGLKLDIIEHVRCLFFTGRVIL